MDVRRQLTVFRRWLPLLIVSTVLSAFAAYAVTGVLPRTYEARSTLVVGQSLSAVNPDYNEVLVAQRLSRTYAAVATTRPLVQSVIDRLALRVAPDELQKRVRADAPLDSTLLTISAQDRDPAVAARIANALADELIAASPAVQGQEAAFQKSIDDDLAATQALIDSTQARIDDLVAIVQRTAQQEAQLQALEARLVSLRATYATLLTFASGNSANLLSVVEPAAAPLEPVSPRTLLNVVVAAVLGLLAAAALALVTEYLDDTVKDADGVQEISGLATLGSIGRMKGTGRRSEIYRLSALLYPRSSIAEAYRTLRTNIEFGAVDAPIRTLLVTSAAGGEGKTVTAANLALVFAQSGRRVLLVDADLRKPGLHTVFDLPNAHGFTTLLRSDAVGLEAMACRTEEPNLRVLTTGPLPPNPAELLGSQRMRMVLEILTAGNELVIFDSPPLLFVTDAAVLSSFIDGTLLVVDSGRSRRAALRQAREALAKAGATILGVVINRVRTRADAEYSAYYGAAYGIAELPAPIATPTEVPEQLPRKRVRRPRPS